MKTANAGGKLWRIDEAPPTATEVRAPFRNLHRHQHDGVSQGIVVTATDQDSDGVHADMLARAASSTAVTSVLSQ